ncbi:H-NS histone family protein [Frateuria sp. STR12]|uniref:H-NS histone family protein n=1 Tax=Frateuria hangzhouensis TaxID=2995589 RepID=UPI0022608775|nr:H-NS histone family protein [Frateuria sp. STR12]MCX7512860.1 H-NS histone family protein [Frateuria sp. STR12]
MAINLDSLSPAELQALIKSAEAQMQAARKNHIQEVRTKIEGLLKSAGLTIDEVYPRRGGQGSKGPKAAVAPKYRNPENPAQTWSGRGKRPLWFSEALKKKGVTADSMLIGSAATKPAPAKKVAPKATKKGPAKKPAKK